MPPPRFSPSDPPSEFPLRLQNPALVVRGVLSGSASHSFSSVLAGVCRMNRKRELFQIPADISPAETGNYYGLWPVLAVLGLVLLVLLAVLVLNVSVFHSLPTRKERRRYDCICFFLHVACRTSSLTSCLLSLVTHPLAPANHPFA